MYTSISQALFTNRTRADLKRKFTLELRRRPWYCSTLQHTATHRNTMQHIATNCNTT